MPEQPEFLQDLLWPFRDYSRVQDFVSQTEAASLLITGIGFLIGYLGYAGTIPSAVGALGLASSVNEVLLRVYYNKQNVWDNLTAGRRGMAVLLNLVVGFSIYLFLTTGATNAIRIALIQFGVGIVLTYLAGAFYMRTYRHIVGSNAHEATKILIPSLATVGLLTLTLVVLPILIGGFFGEEALLILQESPPVNATSS